MNKHLPNKTDDFFLQQLKDYGEEPSKNIWSAIDKRLTEQENAKPLKFTLITLLKAAALMLLLLTPLLLIDSSMKQKEITKQTMNNNVHRQIKVDNYAPGINYTSNSNIIPAIKTLNNKVIVPVIGKSYSSVSNLSKRDFSIAEMHRSNYLNKLVADNKQKELSEIHPLNIFKNDSSKNNSANESKVASIKIKLPNKHGFYIMPFFSADHISGRFIEQYEFDNLSKNDYDKRESPDMSYTTGMLGVYNFYKRFCLMTGLSFSSSNLSITTTAVKALADASGAYKFKLATSYGFAEIDKSGITPNAGDSLLVSSASMQFNYISFPLFVSYNMGGKKIKYSVHGGFALNKLLSEKVEAEYSIQNKDEDETINKVEGIRKTFFTLNTGIEAKYSLSKKIDISLSPELRYGLNSINKKTPIKTFPVNYGVSLNAYLKL